MRETIDYIVNKYNLTIRRPRRPTEIPNMSRRDLPELFRELGFTTGAEIGVQRGLYSEILCERMANLTLYCVDPWTAYREYREKIRQSLMDECYAEALERLQDYSCIFVKKFSMDAVKDFDDASLDFVYIDGNHRIPWVIDDICAWRKKVRSGGIVAGHDYCESKKKDTIIHSKYAVHCAVNSFRIHPWFLVGEKSAPAGDKRDHSRSWFWVRE